jgi:transposase
MRNATEIVLTPQEKQTLEAWSRSRTLEARYVERARMILAAGRGEATNVIARRHGVRPATVSKWRLRFAADRLGGLRDRPRSGAPAVYDEGTEKRILSQLDEPPPRGCAQWNGRLVADALGDVSEAHVWRVLRRHRIQLQRRRR